MMFSINIVNLIQVALFTVSAFGIFLLHPYRQIRPVLIMLALIVISSIFNLLEELNITRQIYLITPIFIIGFGPAIYLSIKGIIKEKLSLNDLWHFAPMILALPFTAYTEVIIAIGTIWRISYAILSLQMLNAFHQRVMQQRSDAFELSLGWLFWGLVIMTAVSMLNLIRLNLQPIISYQQNVFGQGISTTISLLFIAILIRQLVHQKDALIALINDRHLDPTLAENSSEEKSTSDEANENQTHYQQLYTFLSDEIKTNKWYLTPRLSLAQLAQNTGLQSREISRAINLIDGNNFNDFINHLRLDDAILQIARKPNEPILQLAMDVGFNSKSTFNYAFKRRYHKTPQEYKASLLDSK